MKHVTGVMTGVTYVCTVGRIRSLLVKQTCSIYNSKLKHSTLKYNTLRWLQFTLTTVNHKMARRCIQERFHSTSSALLLPDKGPLNSRVCVWLSWDRVTGSVLMHTDI